jgi:outer membrane protein assembly factor BamB
MPRTLLLLALTAALLAMRAQAADDVTMFRGNASHTGVYPGRAIAAPLLRWKFATKGKVIASPALMDGTLYVGSTDGNFYALDAASGTLRWTFQTHARIVSSAAVGNGTVYFSSYDHNFYALDAATGTLKWKFDVAGERRFAAEHIHGSYPTAETMPDPFDFYASSPTLWRGAVYFGSGNGMITALDAASGAVKWTFKAGDTVHTSPAIANGVLYVGSWDSYFYALDASTGKELWRFKTGEDAKIHNQVGIQSSAAVADGIVYFGCRDSNLYAVDAKTGEEVWRVDNKGSWVIASPAVGAGIVYAATSDTGKFFAVDARTGAERFALTFNHGPMFSSPALVGDTVYIGSHMGKLIAIDVKAKRVRWTFETDGAKANLARYTGADGTPNYEAAQSENFYDALVIAVDRLMSTGAVLSSPVADGDAVYFGSTDGNVYAVGNTITPDSQRMRFSQ